MAIQIGKYKRPGIFIEEFDNSIISSPTVAGTTNLVFGFSKKGPVNTPVLVQTITDFENMFGPLDRSMERKGSYFHRTVQKMLESGPVFAMNLLSTSDTLDKIEYKSVSTRTDKLNDVEREGAYRRFFDTTGFWKRDTEAFINLITNDPGDDDRLLSFTNLSDRYVTLFVFKTKLTTFNYTLLQAYGSGDKVPTYVSPLDYASDYIVDALVVAGDWSNYQQLSVDSTWSKYFTNQGLSKDQVLNFANDRNVNLLRFYEGLSLIPFFRDTNGRNIFIETVMNLDTDMTGVFCAFNSDKLEKDFSTGMIDLIGNNLVAADGLVGEFRKTIDYLSYSETIVQEVPYSETFLDLPNNSIAFGPSMSLLRGNWGSRSSRNVNFSEGFVNGLIHATASDVLSGTSSLVVSFTLTDPTLSLNSETSSNAYAIIGGNKVLVNSGTTGTFTYSLTTSGFANNSNTQNGTSLLYIEGSTGTIKSKNGLSAPTLAANDIPLGSVTYSVRSGLFVQSNYVQSGFSATWSGTTFSTGPGVAYFTTGGLTTFASTQSVTLFTASTNYVRGATFGLTVSTSATTPSTQILLYTASVFGLTVSSVTSISNPNVNPVYADLTVDQGGFVDLVNGVDYQVTDQTNGTIKVTFLNTAVTPSTSNYQVYRRIKAFNFLVNMLDSADLDKMVIIKDGVTFEKHSLENATVSGIVTATSQNKSFNLSLGVTSVPQFILAGNLVFYRTDNELVFSTTGKGLLTKSTFAGTGTYGVVSKYSDLYQDFSNGSINTGDFIYHNLLDPDYSFRVILQNSGGIGYITFDNDPKSGNPRFDELNSPLFLVPDSTLNTGTLQLSGETGTASELVDPITGTFYAGTFYTYELTSQVTAEDLSGVTKLYDANDGGKSYLKMYLSGETLTVDFVDSDLSSESALTVTRDIPFDVVTYDSNYKQSIEIEVPSGYTQVENKILVNGSRYTEVKIGDFLEAAVDTTNLEIGQVPRKLTRIINKRVYAPDTTLVEITCDSAIEKVSFGSGDLQTIRYTSIEDYVSTYKAISLKGFRVREASMPDGTETRQNAILNLVAKGTPLFKALTNKEAIDFRYVIDTFGLGLTERSKQQIVDICGERLDCFGFLNMPSLKQFKNSSSPIFVDSEGVLQTSLIASGGDLEKSPAFLYSFGDGRGASSVGYFLPYVTVNDNGRPIDVPPAAYVATTYMRKINTGASTITPWTIAAGVTNGRVINIAGLEQDFTPSDIENLNVAQINPLVLKKNRGFVIETENTAQTLYRSALSYIHVREVLIELERELSAMLLDFQWRFNTAETRAEIKLRADSICESYVNRNGLFNYFNKCDEENNTQIIIDSQIGVLDTYVEPIKGMGIIVNNVTILRTGAIQSGGFINP